MASINTVTLTGNLVKEVDIRTTANGTVVASVTIAVNGFKEDDTSFVDLTFFGKTAEALNNYARKGQKIGVTGRLKQESWDDKETGKKRSKMVVIVDNLELPPKSDSGFDNPAHAQQDSFNRRQTDVAPSDIDDKPIDLSTIPF